MIPGEYFLGEGDINANTGRETVQVKVTNTGDRPVQVGSHYHFFEVNAMLLFDRSKAFGMRLNIPAGTAVRFEPGEEKDVKLVAFGGNKKIIGFSRLTEGETKSEEIKSAAIKAVKKKNFKSS